MKNKLLSIIKFISYFLFVSSFIVFFAGMIIYGDKFVNAFHGWLAGYSIASFAVGMVMLISIWTNWKLGIGLLIFFILLGFCISVSIKYSDQDTIATRLAGFGLPLSVFFLVGWMIWFSVGSNQAANKKLLKKGALAPGKIISFKRTGVTMKVNTDYPHYGVELVIEVHPKNEAHFQAKAEAMLAEHEIANIKEGMHVTVRFNTKNKKKIAVESW